MSEPDTVVPIRADASWGVADNSYDRADFYTSSRSADGASVTLSVKVPAHVASQISAMIHQGDFPYRTPNDFWRDAAHHRLHDLDEMGALSPEFSRRIALWRRAEELDRVAAEVEALEAMVRDTQAMAELLRRPGREDWVMLERLVQETEAAAKELHEPWKGQLLAVVAGLKDREEEG